MSEIVNIKNKRAFFEFEVLDKFIAGIQITGTEIKSIRDSKASVTESYCTFIEDELYVRNMHIAHYKNGGIYNHEEKRDRKLLLQRRELDKLFKKVKEKGFSIIVLRMFINDKGLAKLEIALAQGKKLYDKREDLKSKDAQREMDRRMKK